MTRNGRAGSSPARGTPLAGSKKPLERVDAGSKKPLERVDAGSKKQHEAGLDVPLAALSKLKIES